MEDIRLGLPSSSSLEQLINCPGSHALQRGLPDPDNPWSLSGTRIHAALAAGPESPEWLALHGEELETAERCQRLRDTAFKSWVIEDGGPVQIIKPERLYLRRGLTPIFSGECDFIVVQGGRALVLDYKTGFGEQTGSASNPQLMSYAVLVNEEHGPFESVTVGIVQPLVGGPVELTTYHADVLPLAKSQILRAMDEAADPDAPRIPGKKQCSFCAKVTCPEFNQQLTVMQNTQLYPADSTLARSITPRELADFDERCSFALSMAAKGKAFVQAVVLANPDAYTGAFSIEESKGRETIGELDTVLARMMELGVTQEEFMSCLTARKGDGKTGPGLKGILGRAAGLKGMGLVNALEGCLSGCTKAGEVKQKAVRIGAELTDGEEE